MKRPFLMRVVSILAMFLLGTTLARATYRADFFDVTKPPTVRQENETWTLSNQAVERVIHFDAKTGGLQTVSFRDLRHGRELKPVPGSEGLLTFAAPLLEQPTPLLGWGATDTAPLSDWAKPAYRGGADWKPARLPFRSDKPDKTWWLRCLIPEDRMLPKHAYALILDHALEGDAEIYVDGTLVRKVAATEAPQARVLEIDLVPSNRVIGIKLTGKGQFAGLGGNVSIGEVGTAPPDLDLASDWKLMPGSVNTGEDGSRIVTISLEGIKSHEGFDLDVSYQIFSGDEPVIAKWFTLTSYRTTRYLLEQAVFDRWLLPGTQPETRLFPGSCFAASDPATRAGMITAVLSPLGDSEVSSDGKSAAPVLHPYYLLKTGVVQQTPKAITGFYQGSPATGAFLYQIFVGQYIAHAAPTTVPPAYNTRAGYGTSINAATCEKIIPLAAALGVKLFVLDDGWQANADSSDGRYGDWNVDRSANKFPQGLQPISALVRESFMRFGLWSAPATVSDASKAATDHPDWLLRRADGSREGDWKDTSRMCFTSGWEENYSASMQILCRELTVSYLKLDGGLFADGCVVPAHEHPVSHSLATQTDHWNAFCEKMRKVDPAFIVNRGQDIDPALTAMQDENQVGPSLSADTADALGDPHAWIARADLTRRFLADALWTRPTFTLSAVAPCRLPMKPSSLEALEYALTSAAATACNLEIQGRLDLMTPAERDTTAKWVKWNQDNRPWLAYAQPIASPAAPGETPHIDGVLHLRNAVDGRYGYLCLWNPSDKPDKVSIAFDPADYFVHMNADDVQIIRLKDGKPLSKTAGRKGTVALDDIPMAPLSWEIFEIRRR